MDPYGFIREYHFQSNEKIPVLTSYYYQIRNFPNNVKFGNVTGCPFLPLSINVSQTKWLQVTEYSKLVPTEECTAGLDEWGVIYNNRYRELVLNKLDAQEVYRELLAWAGINDFQQIPVLIGHETYKDMFTERYMVSRWLRANGIPSGELIYPISSSDGVVRYIEY